MWWVLSLWFYFRVRKLRHIERETELLMLREEESDPGFPCHRPEWKETLPVDSPGAVVFAGPDTSIR